MNSNRYPVKVEGKKWGYINGKGEIAIEPQFDFACPFREGLGRVHVKRIKSSKWSFQPYVDKLIDPEGNVVIDGADISDYEENWLDLYPKRAGSLEFHYEDFSEGLAVLNAGDVTGPRCYVDRTGKIVIPPAFEDAYSFSEGLAQVTFCDERYTKTEKFINRKGEIAFEPEVKGWSSEGFREGMCSVTGPIEETYVNDLTGISQNKLKKGYIDREGKLKICLEYDYVEPFRNGLACVGIFESSSAKFYYIDKTGMRYFAKSFDVARSFTDSGVAYVAYQGKSQIIDMRGSVINEVNLNPEMYAVQDFKDGLAMFLSNADNLHKEKNEIVSGREPRVGYMNTTGEIVIPPVFHENSEDFECGLALVTDQEGYTGYIDREGKFVWKTRGWDLSSYP